MKDVYEGGCDFKETEDDHSVQSEEPPASTFTAAQTWQIYPLLSLDTIDDGETTADGSDVYLRQLEEGVGNEGGEELLCPICLENITEDAAAMRCERRHYFHDQCLRRWIRKQASLPGTGASARGTCPLCRGPLQVHRARLCAFLESEEGGELLELERSFFDQILERIQEGNDAWQSLTSEQLLSYGGVMVSFVVGLYSGWSARQWTLVDEIMYSSLDRSNRLATSSGWMLGSIFRLVVYMQSGRRGRRDEDDDD